MSKKDIGTYYRSLSKGDHCLFLSMVCICIGGSYDRWLRVFRAWSRNATTDADASEKIVLELNRLIRNEKWRTTCQNMRRV